MNMFQNADEIQNLLEKRSEGFKDFYDDYNDLYNDLYNDININENSKNYSNYGKVLWNYYKANEKRFLDINTQNTNDIGIYTENYMRIKLYLRIYIIPELVEKLVEKLLETRTETFDTKSYKEWLEKQKKINSKDYEQLESVLGNREEFFKRIKELIDDEGNFEKKLMIYHIWYLYYSKYDDIIKSLHLTTEEIRQNIKLKKLKECLMSIISSDVSNAADADADADANANFQKLINCLKSLINLTPKTN